MASFVLAQCRKRLAILTAKIGAKQEQRSYLYAIFLATIILLFPSATSAEKTTNAQEANTSTASTDQVALIPVEGEIGPATYKFLQRATRDAVDAGASTIIFKINTFGGRLDATYNIVQLLSELAGPDLATLAWVEDKAISAGTLIALSCQQLYMTPGSTLGDVAPIAQGGDGGVTMLGEKFQSPLRAKFRALAEKNNYPVKLTEAFVSADKVIFAITYKDGRQVYLNDTEYNDLTAAERNTIVKKRTVVAKGELLTMNETEALTLGFSRGTAKTLGDILGPRYLPENLTTYPPKQSERIVSYITRYAGILIFLALVGIYLEAQNPGFGLFGVMAISALTVLFLGLFAVELATYGELALLLVGLILLGVELFILPGVGILGLLGVLSILVALFLMLQDFSFPQTDFQLELFKENILTLTLAFIAGTAIFFLSLFFAKKWRRVNPLILQSTLPATAAPFTTAAAPTIEKSASSVPPPQPNPADPTDTTGTHQLARLVASSGKALSDLRPSGKVEIAGTIYDAITEGEYIKAHTSITVQSITGASLVVKAS